MRKRLLVAAMAALGLGLAAAPAGAAESCRLEPIAELKVTMNGMRPMAPARVNDHDAMFLVDSGAFYSVISPGSAAEFGLPLRMGPPGFHIGGVGGEASVSVTTVKTFTLAGAPIPDVQFFVAGSEGGGAGALGQNLLSLDDVEYDLAAGVVRIMKPLNCGDQPLAYWPEAQKGYYVIDVHELSNSEHQTMGTAYVNGTRVRVLFDTGASASVLSLDAARRAGIKPGDPGVVEAGYSRGVGRKVAKTWIAPVASFKIGDETVNNTRLRIGEVGGGEVV